MPRDVIGSGLKGRTVVSLEVKTIQPALKLCMRPVSTTPHPMPPQGIYVRAGRGGSRFPPALCLGCLTLNVNQV